jgi:hypothetical protein
MLCSSHNICAIGKSNLQWDMLQTTKFELLAQTPYYGKILSKEVQNQNMGAFPIVKLEDEEKDEQLFQYHPTSGKPLNRCNIVGVERSFEMTIMI